MLHSLKVIYLYPIVNKIKMKIFSKKPLLRPISISMVLTLLVIVLSFTYLSYKNSFWPFSSQNQATNETNKTDMLPPTEEQITDGYTNKEPETPPTDDKSVRNNSTVNETPQNGKQTITVTITNYQNSNATMSVGAIVATRTDGKCTATLSKSGAIIATVTGSTIPQSSYSSCIDLKLPVNELSGTYTLMVSFSNDIQEGSMTQDVSL